MVVTGKNAENHILSENVEKSGRQIFALISIFSSICVTSIKKIATHSSFENA